MEIIFAGAEVGSHRTLLNDAGVKAVSIDYRLLKKRGLPKKPWLIEGRIPDDVKVYMTCNLGGETPETMGFAEFEDLVSEYIDFLNLNQERIEGAVEPDSPETSSLTGSEMVDVLDIDRVWPIFHGSKLQSLETLANRYPHIALPSRLIEEDTTLAGRTRAVSGIYKTTWHALSHARPDDLRSLPIASVTTLAWLAPMLRGETVVWDGVRLVRYPKRMKEQARMRLGPTCERAGVDYDLVKADDIKSITRLAIWSYLQMQDAMNKNVVDKSGYQDDPGEAETGAANVDNRDIAVRKSQVPVQRSPEQRTALPVLGFEERQVVDYEDGHQVFRTVPIARSSSASLRVCNTCFVAAQCPAMQPDHECAFHLPIEVKTKDQLIGLLQAMIEIQAARASFGRFAEDLNGGYPDPNVSSEIDRLFRLVEKLKDIQENKEFIKITAERSSSGAGILSSIFGPRATELRELPNGGYDEASTTRIMAEVLEG